MRRVTIIDLSVPTEDSPSEPLPIEVIHEAHAAPQRPGPQAENRYLRAVLAKLAILHAYPPGSVSIVRGRYYPTIRQAMMVVSSARGWPLPNSCSAWRKARTNSLAVELDACCTTPASRS